ncbi:alkaline phosphatase [Corynebacterium sp.]|uniref:alkaline phosphatase D family protein n=1 Tax=Corynebacterium sp. TaxID=1720 RepID=UPI0026DAE698|nr:alkaline phosphatase D family protein [Corynebacterium sp.]MDO5032064.1 alkaline phosphatase D family protein [Corynebacterium sp.]
MSQSAGQNRATSEENSSSSRVSRRTALRWGATGATTLAAGYGLSAAGAQEGSSRLAPLEEYNKYTNSTLPFLHGVASGDPLPTSVVLWTRITPDRDSLPGSGLGEDVTVEWEIATDEGFGNIVDNGEETATAEHDHTVHVDPFGLSPETVYYYRFRVASGAHAGAVSPVGRTKTAPDVNSTPERLNFAVASCANYESGFFCAYKDMAERGRAGEIDFVVFLGDYIYEYPTGEYAGKKGVARPHHPVWEITTLEDYRIRYGRYRTDMHLQNAHAAAPWVVVWDDHEVANNNWREGAENHTPGEAEGEWTRRWNDALQAYYEWMPLRQKQLSEGGKLYRNLRFGSLMELTMMDLRSYRDEETTSAHFNDPDRTLLGNEQLAWLRDTISMSDATWMVMGNSVMMAPMRLLTIPGNDAANHGLQYIKGSTSGFALNSDQWDGYTAERDRVLEALDAREGYSFFVTGDIHSEWANDIYLGEKRVACEMVTTSISAPNVDEILTTYTGVYHAEDNSTSHIVEDAIKSANPWVKHLDYDSHGYAVANLYADHVDMNYYRVSDVEDPEASVSLAVTKTWKPEEGFTA